MSFAKILQEFGAKELNRAAYAETEELCQQSSEMYGRLSGLRADEDRVAYALRGWGRSLLQSAKLDEAKNSLQESLDMFVRVRKGKKNQDDVACGLYRQARLLFEEREFNEANRICQECIATCKSLTRISYPLARMILLGQANIALEQNQFEKAEKICPESLSLIPWHRNAYGDNDEDEEKVASLNLLDDAENNMEYVASLLLLARVSLGKGSFEEAQKLCEATLKMVKGIHGNNTNRPEIAKILRVAAEIDFKQGHVQDAVDGLELALKMFWSVFKVAEHPRIVETECELKLWKFELAGNGRNMISGCDMS